MPSSLVAADPCCSFSNQCFCRWRRRLCSARIPCVSDGRDYEGMLAGADNSPAPSWSLLVGFLSFSGGGTSSSLRLHQFHVARSGRVLGQSGDALQIIDDVDYQKKDASSHISGVTATPSPDGGRSICLFSRETNSTHLRCIVAPIPLQLHLNLKADDSKITVSTLACLPPEVSPVMPTRPIAAAGDLWAPYLTGQLSGPSRLVMLRLDKDAHRWVEVAAIDLPDGRDEPGSRGDRLLKGNAVIGGTILLSLQPSHLFFTFDCSTCAWARVFTTKAKNTSYNSILERGVYVEEDDTIYFISGSIVWAYKLCQYQDHYRMAPSTKVDRVCPFGGEEGHGFLTYLGGRILCSVWISASLGCNCDTLHVIITTFRVRAGGKTNRGHFVPNGIEILHSTCRRLDMLPSKPNKSHYKFCFLQEYEELNLEETMLQRVKVATSPNAAEPFKMLPCCREFLSESPSPCVIMLNESSIRTNKALYIICQSASATALYKIDIFVGRLSCHDKTLTPLCIMDTFISDDDYDLLNQPLSWHFVCGSEYIYGIPCIEDEIYEFSLKMGILNLVTAVKRPMDNVEHSAIALVLLVGGRIIAVRDTLQGVYHLSPTHEWTYRHTYRPFDMESTVSLSGYAVLSSDSFMVYDDNSSCCFLLDLQKDRWSVVMPFSELTRSRSLEESQTELSDDPSCWYGGVLLGGKSVFIDGFIYTCTDGGFSAYEIFEEGGSYYLGDEIGFQFPWRKYCEGNRMCLDYICIDPIADIILFCAVQGGEFDSRGSTCKHPVCITTVQVNTERIPGGKLKPVTIGHRDIATSFLERTGRLIWTSNCFAVDH